MKKSSNLQIFKSSNPSNSSIKIISKNSTPIHSFEIYDAMGRKVLNKSNFNESELIIDVENLKQGIYYCKIISENASETISFTKSE